MILKLYSLLKYMAFKYDVKTKTRVKIQGGFSCAFGLSAKDSLVYNNLIIYLFPTNAPMQRSSSIAHSFIR